MPKLSGRIGARALAALVAAAALSLSTAGCKDSSTAPTNPNGSIVVINACGVQVAAFLDGTEKAKVENQAQATLQNVVPGSHRVEVKKVSDGLTLFDQTMVVTASSVNYVSVRGGGSVRVTNLYGEVLSIFDGEAYVGDIGDQITQTITKITYGTHVFTAKKRSDGTVAATVSIDIADFTEHVWAITP